MIYDRLSRWAGLAAAVALLGCGNSEGTATSSPPAFVEPPRAAPPEPAALEPPPPELPLAPAPSGPSCDEPELAQCTEYPEGHHARDVEARCGTALGHWRAAPCAREGVAGLCLIDHGPDSGAVRTIGEPIYGPRTCRIAGGRFGVLRGDRIDIAPAPPSYVLEIAEEWIDWPPWLPLQEAALTNVVYLRGPLLADGSRPGLSIQRRALAEGTSLEAVTAARRTELTADTHTTILETTAVSVGGLSGTLFELALTGHFDLGATEALRAAIPYDAQELIVLVDGEAWTLVCGGSEAERRHWRPDCEAMIATLRIEPRN